jgi:beta-aspartyl-peptidase (threonine type)
MSSAAAASPKTALVIHGGAGVITRAQLSAEDQIGYEKALNAALDAGNAVLQRGGSARDAVIASVTVLEDSPLFNAGKGAVYNAEGGHELDASLMEGHTGKAGAVAGLRTIKNPILLAEAVMQHSTHVLLAGEGAEHFADTRKDIVRVAPEYFDTEHRYKQLMKAKAEERQTVSTDLKGKYFGTVGAVALDRNGHIAAATSTGGMTNKRWSRIGDSPIIGAGTYANEQCGVSATGWGEFFIRAVVAHDICARMMYRGDSLAQAAEEVLLKVVPEMGGDGGVVALDRDGNVSLPFNTEGMYRGWIRPDGSRGVAIFSD